MTEFIVSKRFLIRSPLLIFVCLLATAITTVTGASQNQGSKREVSPMVREKIISQLQKDQPDLLECFEETDREGRKKFLSEIEIDLIDLNRDGRPEYHLQPQGGCTCGAQNCSFWIYRQVADGFVLMLDTSGLGLSIEKTVTNGYFDVSVGAHNNALTRYITYYRFDGKEYRDYKTDFENLETGESKPAQVRVRFQRGSSSTVVRGKASLGFPDTYLIGARGGQTMTLQLNAPPRRASFTLFTPGSKEILTNSATRWTGVLPETGDYYIIVDGDEKGAQYTLNIAIR
ncbi:MAG: hypothetical protein L0229_22895 [Blastocatellia bacterium]|nr:hypothetical protein [Blastocatellia bacterium]